MRGRLALSLVLIVGCGSQAVPDPKTAADDYAKAAERGDADALYDMMATRGRADYSRGDVARLVREQKPELQERARDLQKSSKVLAHARLRFRDGEEASLELKDGRYWVASAADLPGGARTPEQALDQLRRVLARRSYAGLMRVLTPATRKAIEDDLRSLVEGLERADTLEVRLVGDTATVTVPGGHVVKLRRQDGVWRVEDFD